MLSVLQVSCNDTKKAQSSSSFIADFEHFQYSKLVLLLISLGSVSEAYLGPYQTSMMELFYENI